MKNKLNNELAVCGFAAVKSLEKKNPEQITRLYFTAERAPLFGGLCKKLSQRKAPYNQVRDPIELERLSGTVHHQGVVAMIEAPEIQRLNTDIVDEWIAKKESALLLDRVGNANNLGAIVRSAAFFGMKNIVIPEDESQSSITTSSYRVAQGGMEFVDIFSVKSIPALLQAIQGKMIRIGTAANAKTPAIKLQSLCQGKGALIILGNEENGISQEVRAMCDETIAIPHCGARNGNVAPIESLNVAQSASIILYELQR
ncbi:MAG: RNA methyltransferase [Treponemataceae bacterium]|nr:RNA methyltransferase [Treponemataceae bacterium]